MTDKILIANLSLIARRRACRTLAFMCACFWLGIFAVVLTIGYRSAWLLAFDIPLGLVSYGLWGYVWSLRPTYEAMIFKDGAAIWIENGVISIVTPYKIDSIDITNIKSIDYSYYQKQNDCSGWIWLRSSECCFDFLHFYYDRKIHDLLSEIAKLSGLKRLPDRRVIHSWRWIEVAWGEYRPIMRKTVVLDNFERP